jgi:general secretion pathway protein J
MERASVQRRTRFQGGAVGQAGFTLLEMLVALVILSILMLGLIEGLRLGVRIWRTQASALTTRGDLDAMDTTLRTLIARMDPGGVSGRPPTFMGRAHALAFTTALPQAAGMLATRDADVMLAVGDDRTLQMALLTHYPNPLPPRPRPERITLLRDVERVEFSYWQDHTGQWLQEWTDLSLPRLIRMHLVFTSASGRQGPDIVMMPMRHRWRQ